MARTRNAGGTRQALKETTNSTKQLYSNDGDFEGLITDKKRPRGRPRAKSPDRDQYLMTGALPNSESADPLASSSANPTTDELAKDDAPAPVAAKPNRRPPRTAKKVVPSDSQMKTMDQLKQRMAATAQKNRTKEPATLNKATGNAPVTSAKKQAAPTALANATAERSGFSLSPSPSPPGKLTSAKAKRTSLAQPSSALRAQATPAVEASLLALKNFKRRPRQPSMLAMVQQRTASARPSMNPAAAADDLSVFDLDSDGDDDEDDFAPDAEGTPLHSNKAKSRASLNTATTARPSSGTSQSRKRKSQDPNASVLSSKRSKRQHDAHQSEEQLERQASPESSPEHLETSEPELDSERLETPQPQLMSEIQVLRSQSSTPPTPLASSQPVAHGKSDDNSTVIPSTERQNEEGSIKLGLNVNVADEDPAGSDGAMAEPVSSSPVGLNVPPTQSADYLADPQTQASPASPKRKPQKKVKPASTADLQSMLPKRRQPPRPRHRKSEYDMESNSDHERDDTFNVSHLEEDEDELGGRLPQSAKKSKASKAKKPAGNKKGRQTKAPAGRKAHATTQQKKGSRTYGKGAISDKENNAEEDFEDADEPTLPDGSVSMLEAARSKELEDAKKKFFEVDEWDMEFESMSADGRRSSQSWR